MDDGRVLRILLCIVGIVFILMGFINVWIYYFEKYFDIALRMFLILLGFITVILLFMSKRMFLIYLIFLIVGIITGFLSILIYIYIPSYVFCLVGALVLGLAYRYRLLYELLANGKSNPIMIIWKTLTKEDKPTNLENNDCFGTLKKVDAIEKILRSEILNNHSTAALYGDWGSGKSSVILTLIDRFERDRNSNIIAIKFDAWKYEREESLSYALLEFIINELEKNDDKRIEYKIRAIKDDVLKSGRIVLKSVGISLSPISLSFENKDVDCKDIDNLVKNLEKISEILRESNKKLIVFIDELDRCEPEHILELLSSLKAIFNASNDNNGKSSIIYFVAIDKEAVSKAIKTKYEDIIKAEEYLEKIFNVSFSMPKIITLKDFIKSYPFFNNDEIAEKLAKFFEAINFTNPRRLKKVLNKYAFLVKIKNSDDIDDELKELIPKIITGNNNNDEYLFDTIFVLYFIILYEFYYEEYLEIKNIHDKLNNYISHQNRTESITRYLEDKFDIKFKDMVIRLHEEYEKLDKDSYEVNKLNYYLIKLVCLFTPLINTTLKIYDISRSEYNISREESTIGVRSIKFEKVISNMDNFINQFEYKNNEILIDFCKYLISEDFFEIIKADYEKGYNNDNYTFKKLFDMVETLL